MRGIDRPNCYVASPYGFAESTLGFYHEVVLKVINKYANALDPFSFGGDKILKAPLEERSRLWRELGLRNLVVIEHEADIVVAGLDQEPCDAGTLIEVGFTAGLPRRVPIIGYRGDFRTSGEEGLPYNLMIGAAIERTGGEEVSTINELEISLAALVRTIS